MTPTPSLLHRILLLAALLSSPRPTLQHNSGPSRDDNDAICTWNLRGGGAFPRLVPIRDSCPKPIDTRRNRSDDASRPRSQPWSYKPYCLRPADVPKGSSPKLCVYTSTHFRGGHGLSLLTTPDLAASVADSLDDSLVDAKLRDHPGSSMAAPSARKQRSYTVRELPGRGKGTVATRDVAKFEVIHVGYPAIVAQMDYTHLLSKEQAAVMLQKAVGQLPAERQEEIWALARSTGAADPMTDILKTNIFGLEVDGVSHMGLYPEGSRVNHNCRPNTFWRSSPRTLTMEVVAMRDIKAGEEIVHSYAPLGSPYEERKMILGQWGFTCSCALCSLPPSERARSDGRRNRIWEVYADLTNSAAALGRKVVDERVDELVYLVEREELWPQLVEYYQLAARAYITLREYDLARGYVQKAEATWIEYGGVDHDGAEDIRQLWTDLRRAERDERRQNDGADVDDLDDLVD